MFRSSSSAAAVALLIAFNLLPLVGVLVWGWNVQSLLVLYWLENGIIGLLAIPRILRAEGSPAPPGVTVKVGSSTASKFVLVPFFLLHYGIFWTVHGAFVFMLPLFLSIRGMIDGGAPATAVVRWDSIGLAALGLAISHGASFVLNYLGRREYLTTSPAAQMTAPYGRVVVLHVTILAGVFVSIALGTPIGALVVLVVLKTVVDLAAHLAEHRRAATRPPLPSSA